MYPAGTAGNAFTVADAKHFPTKICTDHIASMKERGGRTGWSQVDDPSQLFTLLTIPGFDTKHLAQEVWNLQTHIASAPGTILTPVKKNDYQLPPYFHQMHSTKFWDSQHIRSWSSAMMMIGAIQILNGWWNHIIKCYGLKEICTLHIFFIYWHEKSLPSV